MSASFIQRPLNEKCDDFFAEIARGLSFNSADHALDAASEGAGVLLVQNILAYNLVHSGRLVIPVRLALRSGRAYYLVRPKRARERPQVRAFIDWLKQEFAALDWTIFDPTAHPIRHGRA